MPAPAAQPGTTTAYRPRLVAPVRVGSSIAAKSDEFNGSTLSSQWSWVNRPPAGSPVTLSYGLTGAAFRFDVQHADLFVDSNTASILSEPAPAGDYLVTTRVHLNVPREGCCFNFAQAGLVIFDDVDNFIKLSHFALFETRQTEFAKEVKPVPTGYPRYGNSVVGPPADWTYLRIAVHHVGGGQEQYTAFTSQDGAHWVRGGTWTHHLGSAAKIGLISMALTDPNQHLVAKFDWVHVNRIG
jgi:arabinan endo-1,5-alpha-L-arabinosidase